jgi:hypothetical protein
VSSPRLVTVPAPASPVFRVAYGPDPFRPLPWSVARLRTPNVLSRHNPKHLGGRFDDPPLARGRQYPEARRFRTLYCATDPAGAFVEALHSFSRWDKPVIPDELEAVIRAELRLRGLVDSLDPRRGLVPWSWFRPRVVGETRLDPDLVFVDVAAGGTIRSLGALLAPLLARHALPRMGYSVIVGPTRAITQAIASQLYEFIGGDDADPPYAGIRYESDLDPQHECWAVFATRLSHQPVTPTAFKHCPVAEWLATPGLWEAATYLYLTLEGPDGRLYRPDPGGGFSVA